MIFFEKMYDGQVKLIFSIRLIYSIEMVIRNGLDLIEFNHNNWIDLALLNSIKGSVNVPMISYSHDQSNVVWKTNYPTSIQSNSVITLFQH